jgi:hypothetical protein
MRMRHIITSYVACAAVLYFTTLSNKQHDFRKQAFEHKMCIFIFSTNLLKHFSLQEELREIWSKTNIGLHVKYPLFLSDLN